MSNSKISSDVIGDEDEKGGQAKDQSTKKVRHKDQRVESNSMTMVGLMSVPLWSMDFDPAKPYPSMFKTWIRLSGLPGHLYNRKILWEIGELVGKVVRLDFNIYYRARGRFDHMVLFINLDKLLVSQTLINGVLQLIEYESLSEGQPVVIERGEPDVAMESTDKEVESVNYGQWMLVERKSRRNLRDDSRFSVKIQGVGSSGSRFNILADGNKGRNDTVGIGEISKGQSKRVLNGNKSEAINFSKNSGLGPTLVIEGNSFNEDREGVTNLAPLEKTCPWFAYNSPNNIFDSRGNFMLGSVGCSNGGIFSIEGPIKMDVGVRESLLDVGKHNPVVFKENKMPTPIDSCIGSRDVSTKRISSSPSEND
ncbi:hypothetical protein Golob_004099, partial [Gossypium lobatum]|nr:hypothetical protein [Gossypium lobatum]